MAHTVTDSHDMKQSNGRFGQVLSLSKANNICWKQVLFKQVSEGHV